MIVIYLKDKSKYFQKLEWYLEIFEKETKKNLKCLRSNKWGEIMLNEFNEFYNQIGIKGHLSTLGTLERRNRSIMDCARKLMIDNSISIN